jgi:hypothetical protein
MSVFALIAPSAWAQQNGQPSLEALQEMSPSERREAVGSWRQFLQGLSEEERAELRTAMQERGARGLAYRDSLTEAEREAMKEAFDERRAEIKAEIDAHWETLPEDEKQAYLSEAGEKIEERRGQGRRRGFRAGPSFKGAE